MSFQTSKEEYIKALRMGRKEMEELAAAGKSQNPACLDVLVPEIDTLAVRDLGVLEIPVQSIAGTKSLGRTGAFTPTFLPLLEADSEFAFKWIHLCDAHLSAEGIRDPITCFEYLGRFYVQEGNKRVSVLRYFGAGRIPAQVKRCIPAPSEDPRVQAYYEFMEFFEHTGIYTVQYRKPGEYGKLLSLLGRKAEEKWTEDERRTFNARFTYFQDALRAANSRGRDILPEEALLLWLQLYPYADLSSLSEAQLKRSVSALWEDIVSVSDDSVKLETRVNDSKPGILSRIISSAPDCLHVAFLQQLSPVTSGWALGHDRGRQYLEEKLGDRVTVQSYFDVNTPEETEQAIDSAAEAGAQVIFTTVPQMATSTLKAALKYPRVLFFNCSLERPYSSIRSYYGRIYEAKFIAGAIAGAMACNDRIGYIASYPILGVPASINAFALGAQLTNPRAQICLRWSCMAGAPQADFFAEGIRVISNRDVPIQSKVFLDFCSYGTYLMDDRDELIPLASPVWQWGRFYESICSAILSGSLKQDKAGDNYWLGMDGGYIDIELSDRLPEGVRMLAETLKQGIRSGSLDPFAREIHAQDGSLLHDGQAPMDSDTLLHMDRLCDNIVGSIPEFDEILPMSQAMVRELGIHRERIPL